MRFALLGLALLACGWFVVGIRQNHELDGASAIVAAASPVDAAQARHGAALLRSAAFLDPDKQVAVVRAQLDDARGELPAARALLRSVVASEPDNVQAWLALESSSAGDPREFYLAALRIQQLVPPIRAKH